MAHGDALIYAEVHEAGYEDLAAKSFTASFVPNSENPSDIYVSGPCPRCAGQMTYRHPLLIVRGIDEIDAETAEGLWDLLRARGREPPSEWSFTVYCQCRVTHAQAPAGAPGCGAYWGMTVVRPVLEAQR